MRYYLKFLNDITYFLTEHIRKGDIPAHLEDGSDRDDYLKYEVATIERIAGAHIFTIDDITKKLLLLTKPPNKNSMLKLPFPSIFIDVAFGKDEIKQLGMEMDDRYDKIIGIHVFDQVILEDDNLTKKGRGMMFHIMAYTEDHGFKPLGFIANTDVNENYFSFKCKPNTKSEKIAHLFTLNFINLINDPDVELVHMDRERLKKRNQKLIRKQKPEIKDIITIRLSGKLRIYRNQLNANKQIWRYNFSFWVRGHFRHFRSSRFVNVTGKRTWIPPFIKGKGILIEKEYYVDKKERNP